MAIYVQLADRLLKVSNDVTVQNITDALGYVPFNGEFSELKNSPFYEDNSGEYNVVDEAGHIILKINQDGVKTTKVLLPKGDVQEQIDSLGSGDEDLRARCDELQAEIESLGVEVENIDFASLKNNPITITDGEFIIMDDKDPANIGLKLDTDGLFVRDVYIDGNSIKGKLIDIDNTFLNVGNEISNLHAEDNVLASEIEDVAAEVNGMKNNFTTNNLTVNTQSNLKGSTIISGVATIEGETTFSGTTTIYGTTTIEDITTDTINTNDAELKFADEEGHTVAKIDDTGVSAFEFNVVSNNEVTHKLSEKANQLDLETAVTELTTIIEGNELVWAEAFNVHEERLTTAESDIDNLENTKADKETVNTQINTLTQSLEDHTKVKATTSTLGHVTLNSGDSSTNSYVDGVAAASKHYHSQYVENTGDTINGNLTVTGTVEMGDMVLRKDEYTFADASGNVITRIDDAGVAATEFTAGDHKLTLKADQSDFENHYNTLADANTLAHVKLQSGDFKEIKTTEAGVAASPNHTHGQYLLNTTDTLTGDLTVTGTVEMGDMVLRRDEFVFTDESGNAIARIDDAGVESTEFTAGDHKLTLKADQSDLESHEVTKATDDVLAHVKLQSGDFEGITTTEAGVAASPNHTHGQYSLSGHTHGTITLSGDVTGSAKIGSGTTAVNIEVEVLTDSHEHTDYLYNNQDDIFDGNLQVTKNLTVDGTVEMGDMVLRKDEFVFTDESGNAIARIDDAGVASTEFTAGEHKLTLKADKATVDSQISGMTANFEDHVQTKADANTLAHVKLQSGDFKEIKTTEAGVAASPNHTHGQYSLSGHTHGTITLSGDVTGSAKIGSGTTAVNIEVEVLTDSHEHTDYLYNNQDDIFDGNLQVTKNLTVDGTVEMGDMVLRKDEFVFTDESGNAIARIDDAGVASTEFTAGEHKLTLKADKATVDSQISGMTANFEDHVQTKADANTLAHVKLQSGDFKEIKTTEAGVAASPNHTHGQYLLNTTDTLTGDLTVTGTVEMGDMVLRKDEFVFTDESGNAIARIDDAGVESTEFTAGEHKLTLKADQSDLESNYAEITSIIEENEKTTAKALTGHQERLTTAESDIDNLENVKADKETVNTQINTLTQSLEDHTKVKATTSTLGHVTLNSGDSSTNSFTNGVAAASKHYHSQYVENTGDTINGNLTVTGTLDTNDLALNKTEFTFADPSGNTIAKINSDGFIDAVDYVVKGGDHKLTLKADQQDLEDAIATINANITNNTSGLNNTINTLAGRVTTAETNITNLGNNKADKTTVTELSNNFADHIASSATTSTLGHVKLQSGDLSGITATTNGVAASSYHTHSQYLPTAGGTVTGDLTVNGTLDTNDLALNKTEFVFADPSGNTVAKINSDGFTEAVDFITKDSVHKLSEKVDASYVENAILDKLAANDAMLFKGTISKEGDFPKTFQAGYTYKVSTAGTYYGQKVEIGDMIIAVKDGSNITTSSSNFSTYWTIIQVNTDGHVTGPASATNERIAVFDGTTGKLIKDGGSKISDLAPKNHASTATTYGSGTTTNYGHVKLKEGDLSGVTATTNGVAASSYHTHSQYAPKNHASTATTYGSGTTSTYGHVKINSGDCSTNTFTNGVAAASKHSHSEMTVTASATTFYLIGQSGTTTATSKLYKNSGVYVSGGTKVCATNGFYQTSDANLKDFHGEIPVDFEKLKQIPKVYYSWKSDNNKTMYIGTSAQEVQKVYPELVATNTETGDLSVDYPKLSMVGLKAVDVLYEENQMLKQEINTLKDELKLIKEKLGL